MRKRALVIVCLMLLATFSYFFPIQISVANEPPFIPSGPHPENNSVDVSIHVNLSWLGGDPDPGDIVTYDVYFGTSNPPPQVTSNQSYYDPGVLRYYTRYYWRVVAWDNHNTSAQGPLWHFKTIPSPYPPYPPSNPNPSDGATNVPTDGVILLWECNCPDPYILLTFDVYFGSSFPYTKIVSNTTQTSCYVDNLSYNTTYHWFVVAWDNYGTSLPGPLWSFTTEDAHNYPPTLGFIVPKRGFIYLWGKPIWIGFTTVIIGSLDIIVWAIANDTGGISRVEFFLDDKLVATDYTGVNNTYSWTWDTHGPLFPYNLGAKAYDLAGNSASIQVRVWKIF